MLKKMVTTAAALFSCSVMAGGIKVFPMIVEGVGVGVPKAIYIQNDSESVISVTTADQEGRIMLFPPVIEDLQPGEKKAVQVAFMSQPEAGKKNRDVAFIRVSEGAQFAISVIGL